MGRNEKKNSGYNIFIMDWEGKGNKVCKAVLMKYVKSS